MHVLISETEKKVAKMTSHVTCGVNEIAMDHIYLGKVLFANLTLQMKNMGHFPLLSIPMRLQRGRCTLTKSKRTKL